MQNKIIFTLLVICLLLSFFVIKDKKDVEYQDWIWVSPKQHSLDVIMSCFNGKDTISIDFGDDSDILTFIPDGNGVGYIIYSEIAEDEHCMDYLWMDEAKNFAYWVRTFPIYGDDREKANEYYRNILNKYVYIDTFDENTPINKIN